MKIKNGTVCFESNDMNFAAKFGPINAAEMVFDYKSQYNIPFIYDTYQLANFFKIGRKTLFDIVKDCNNMYNSISIPKKSGGCREIDAPNDTLKNLQNKILSEILVNMPVSKHATAYHCGAKLINNAKPHTSKKFLLKLDLKDFFGNIRFDKIYSTVFNTKYFPKQIGVMLTTLCCKDDVLPQGSPCSPAISNIVMKNFDNNFYLWCKNHGFSYTRYCDDITVSGNSSLYIAYQKAESMLIDMGFEINSKKTHFITNAGRQTVTGLTVNQKVSIPSDYKRRLRQEIYYANKFGIESAILHDRLSGYNSNTTADNIRYYNYLMGKINYVLSIEPENKYFSDAKILMKKFRLNRYK